MDNIANALDWLNNIPSGALLLIALFAVGYIIKQLAWVPNKLIPLLLIVAGGVLYPVIEQVKVKPILIGVIIGFIAWLSHNKLIKAVEGKIPFLKDLANDEGEPVEIQVKSPDKP